MTGEGTGDGAIDALLQAINAATGIPGVLKEYHVAAVTADTDALGEVSVLVEHDGRAGLGPERLDGHAGGVGARLPARAVERAGGSVGAPPRSRRPRPKPERGRSRARLHLARRRAADPLRRGRARRAPALLAARGFEGYALLTTERAPRAGAGAASTGADVVLDVPAGARAGGGGGSARAGRRDGRWWRSAAAG